MNTLTRRDLIRRGAAIGAGLIAGAPFVRVLASAVPNLRATLRTDGWIDREGLLDVSVYVRNEGTETVEIDVAASVRLELRPVDRNAVVVPISVASEDDYGREGGDSWVALAPGEEDSVSGSTVELSPDQCAQLGAGLSVVCNVRVFLWVETDGDSERIEVPCEPITLMVPA